MYNAIGALPIFIQASYNNYWSYFDKNNPTLSNVTLKKKFHSLDYFMESLFFKCRLLIILIEEARLLILRRNSQIIKLDSFWVVFFSYDQYKN